MAGRRLLSGRRCTWPRDDLSPRRQPFPLTPPPPHALPLALTRASLTWTCPPSAAASWSPWRRRATTCRRRRCATRCWWGAGLGAAAPARAPAAHLASPLCSNLVPPPHLTLPSPTSHPTPTPAPPPPPPHPRPAPPSHPPGAHHRGVPGLPRARPRQRCGRGGVRGPQVRAQPRRRGRDRGGGGGRRRRRRRAAAAKRAPALPPGALRHRL
jgi:hypothetical protein